jgi:predicted GTPase
VRELIAGEGGSVLVYGANRADAVLFACEGIAEPVTVPSGLPVVPIDALPDEADIDVVRLLPCESVTRRVVEAWASARSIPVERDHVTRIAAPDATKVVAVSATTTGSGKTAVTRRIARTLLATGKTVAVARHPIPSLLHWGRFDVSVVHSPAEVRIARPIDEHEELAPVVGTRAPVATGLDAERIVAAAAREGSVIVWDGGGAAEPWVVPDIHVVAVDCLREPSEIRDADIYVLTKADSAGERARATESLVRAAQPDAPVLLADLAVGVQPTQTLADRNVVIVEGANSLVLGGLSAGAGAVAAKRFRCGVVDPRPFAVGAIAKALTLHPHIGAVIPSLGRTPAEIDDLAASVASTPGEVVLWASNADPATVIPDERRPIVRAFGELTQVAGSPLQDLLLERL